MKVRMQLKGTVALLVQNKRLADPLDPATKRLTALTRGKASRDRTEEDFEAIARAEFEGAIYGNDALGPYAPTEWLEQSLRQGAHMAKKNSGKLLLRALVFLENEAPLIYDGPRKIADLWEDPNYRFTTLVRNPTSQARVPRTRPMFQQWSLVADAFLDTSLVELDSLILAGATAGMYHGIGSWRPKYGRFEFAAWEI